MGYLAIIKITIDISKADISEICRLTGERTRRAALQKFIADAVMLRRRQELTQKFISGEWGVEFEGFEAGQERDRQASEENQKRWRM